MAVTAFYTFFNQNFARFCSINEFFLVCHCLHTLEYVHSTASSGSAKVVCQSDFSIIYRPFSDGASSVILCNEKFAKEHGGDYVKVIGSGRGGSPAALQGREHITTIPSTKYAAEAAYKMAGITPKEIDFAEVHDCFTIAEVVDTEDLGFFDKGMGAKAAREGS